MVITAPISAKLVEARGARFTLLFGYVFLAKRYFFRIPLRGVLLATFLYGLALVASRA